MASRNIPREAADVSTQDGRWAWVFGALVDRRHPKVVEAVHEQIERGTHFGASQKIEIARAESILRLVPSAERAFSGKIQADPVQASFRAWRARLPIDPQFLHALRELTRQHGVRLIFPEPASLGLRPRAGRRRGEQSA
jgi:glutamate-1-semialdehyde aminotransferase